MCINLGNDISKVPETNLPPAPSPQSPSLPTRPAYASINHANVLGLSRLSDSYMSILCHDILLLVNHLNLDLPMEQFNLKTVIYRL